MRLIFKDNANYFRYHIRSYRVELMANVISGAVTYINSCRSDKANKFAAHTLLVNFLVDVLGAEYSTIPHKDLEILVKGVKKKLPKAVALNKAALRSKNPIVL